MAQEDWSEEDSLESLRRYEIRWANLDPTQGAEMYGE